MNRRRTVFSDFRGIVSDWLLNLALTVAPDEDKADLAAVLNSYQRTVLAKYAPRMRKPVRDSNWKDI